MPEGRVERAGELLRSVFQILETYLDGLAAREVLSRLEEVVPPAPRETAQGPLRPAVGLVAPHPGPWQPPGTDSF